MSERAVAPKVVVVGSAHVDLVAGADRLPVRGETLPGHRFAIHPGGKGANQAVQAALAGAQAVMIGRVGDDEFGRRLRSALAAKGVDVSGVGVDPSLPTGASVVLTGDHDGDYASIVVAGASRGLTPEQLDHAADRFAGAAVVLAQLEIAAESSAQALRIGRRADATTILNAAPAPPSVASLRAFQGLIDVLVVNAVEAAMLTGRPTGEGERIQVEAVAAELRGLTGAAAVLITLGADGAAALSSAGYVSIPGRRVAVVDTIGAGDAFAGTVAVALAAGRGLEEAIARGVAAGALAVGTAGAYDALPTAAAVDALLAGP